MNKLVIIAVVAFVVSGLFAIFLRDSPELAPEKKSVAKAVPRAPTQQQIPSQIANAKSSSPSGYLFDRMFGDLG